MRVRLCAILYDFGQQASCFPDLEGSDSLAACAARRRAVRAVAVARALLARAPRVHTESVCGVAPAAPRAPVAICRVREDVMPPRALLCCTYSIMQGSGSNRCSCTCRIKAGNHAPGVITAHRSYMCDVEFLCGGLDEILSSTLARLSASAHAVQ